MRGIIIDKNFSEAFVCLEDGETISIPSSEVTDSNVGDMITLSNISISFQKTILSILHPLSHPLTG